MANSNVTIIDPEGDFILTVGSTPFRVSTDTIGPRSPFLKQLLADGRTSTTVSGNPEAASHILNIWHYNVDDVPETLSITTFYEIAKLIEEWKGQVKVLGLHSRKWIKAWSLEEWDERKPQDWEKWAKIGGVWGMKEDIVQVVLKDMLKTVWDKMDQQEVDTFSALAAEYGFAELRDELIARRGAHTSEFQIKFKGFIEQLYTEPPSRLCKMGEQECGSMIVISLLQKFYAAGFLNKSEDLIIPFNKVKEIVSVDGVDVVHVPDCLDAVEVRLRALLGGARIKNVEFREPKPTPILAPPVEIFKVDKQEIKPRIVVSPPKVEAKIEKPEVFNFKPTSVDTPATEISVNAASIATQASDTMATMTPAPTPALDPSLTSIPTPQATPQSTPQPPAKKSPIFSSIHAPAKVPVATVSPKKQTANNYTSEDDIRPQTLGHKIWPDLGPGELQPRVMSWDASCEAAVKAIEQEEEFRKELESAPKLQAAPTPIPVLAFAPAPQPKVQPQPTLPSRDDKLASAPIITKDPLLPHLMSNPAAPFVAPASAMPAIKPSFSNPLQPHPQPKLSPSPKPSASAASSTSPLAPVQWTLEERRSLMALLQADEGKKDLLKGLRKRFRTVPTDHIVNVLYRARWNMEEANAKLLSMELQVAEAAQD